MFLSWLYRSNNARVIKLEIHSTCRKCSKSVCKFLNATSGPRAFVNFKIAANFPRALFNFQSAQMSLESSKMCSNCKNIHKLCSIMKLNLQTFKRTFLGLTWPLGILFLLGLCCFSLAVVKKFQCIVIAYSNECVNNELYNIYHTCHKHIIGTIL